MGQILVLPDNDQPEPHVKGSRPLVKYVGGHWCWLEPGTNDYRLQPALEQRLLAALARERKAA